MAWLERRRHGLAVGAVALALAAGAPAVARADAVIAAAGDIACDPLDASFNGGFGTSTRCRQKYTSNLLLASGYDAVLALGDLQYNAGSLANFQRAYDPTWGRVKAITRPVIGNHEGNTATTGAGYCTYWGAAAHCNAANRQGNAAFYSFDIGGWHVVVLNSNCTAAGGCGVGSPQYTWLQNDLAAHPATCTLGVWHHPRFSSGLDGSNTFMQPIWKLLYDAGADLVLVAHSHDYERFAPMDGNGALNRTNGMREIVVGTGGVFFTGFSSTAPNSELRNNRSYGILKLTLHAASYDWQFIPESGGLFDSGSGPCRGAAPPSPPPPSPPPPSPPPPPPPPPGNTQTFRADADSSVVSGAPNSNLGTATTLLSTSGAFTAESYLRFTVSGVGGGTVTSAKLRLFVPSDATVDGPGVYACSDPACATWSETGITWNNRPPRASTATADVGAIARGTTAEWDVTPLVAGNSAVTLVVGPAPTTDSVSFSSHEASANQPQLVVTTS